MKLVPHIILSVLTVCLATECTKVNYGAPEDMPESVAVSFKFDWQDQEAPGEMYVVMSRIINTVHYGWLVAPDGTVTGQIPDYETPQDDGTGDENTGETGDDEGNTGTGEGNDGGQTDETATENTAGKGVDVEYDTDNPTVLPSMTVMNGEYYIMSFNQNVTSFSTSRIRWRTDRLQSSVRFHPRHHTCIHRSPAGANLSGPAIGIYAHPVPAFPKNHIQNQHGNRKRRDPGECHGRNIRTCRKCGNHDRADRQRRDIPVPHDYGRSLI